MDIVVVVMKNKGNKMGLDLHAYTKIKLVQPKTEDIECLHEWADEQELDGFCPYINEHFALQGVGLEDGWYSYHDSMHVCSRAYSGWSRLRDALARAVGWVAEPKTERFPYQQRVFNSDGGVLHELICFSDCEGVINTECCKKIYNDLSEVDIAKLNEQDYNSYKDLVAGFKFASENEGVVTFG